MTKRITCNHRQAHCRKQHHIMPLDSRTKTVDNSQRSMPIAGWKSCKALHRKTNSLYQTQVAQALLADAKFGKDAVENIVNIAKAYNFGQRGMRPAQL